MSSATEPFQIMQLHADSPEVIEQLGSKRKFWFRVQGDVQPWLFKYTRENTGEDWSEKIAAELAILLRISAARVELAAFMGKRGCASRSFVETTKGFELIHGSEILVGRVHRYEKSKQWGQSDHCLENIIAAVEQVFPPRLRTRQLRTLASFIVFDGLICNTDRHHDNWGLLRILDQKGKTRHSVASTFDHASSLGRELLEDRCKMILASPGGIDRYVGKGHGGIYFDKNDRRGENPLSLAIKAAEKYPDYFVHIFRQIALLNEDEMCAIVYRVPSEWMSESAKEFCCRMLATTLRKLKEVQL
ncbi:MAG: HipA domain-containing protein [Desulfuromonadales bacterium]|nr:HipA domain-containing protein [Desulfuromonadales bacterium]